MWSWVIVKLVPVTPEDTLFQVGKMPCSLLQYNICRSTCNISIYEYDIVCVLMVGGGGGGGGGGGRGRGWGHLQGICVLIFHIVN